MDNDQKYFHQLAKLITEEKSHRKKAMTLTQKFECYVRSQDTLESPRNAWGRSILFSEEKHFERCFLYTRESAEETSKKIASQVLIIGKKGLAHFFEKASELAKEPIKVEVHLGREVMSAEEHQQLRGVPNVRSYCTDCVIQSSDLSDPRSAYVDLFQADKECTLRSDEFYDYRF